MAFNRSNLRVYGDANNTVSRDQYIVGGDQHIHNEHKGSDIEAFNILAKQTSVNAFHDAEHRFPQPNCHPGTRIEMLQKLSSWIEERSEAVKVFWVRGTVGVGKSAIAQNLSESYFGSRIAAAFFFSRNDGTRDKLDSLVASIVYQFSKSPSLWGVLGTRILEAIVSDPKIFGTTFENQFQRLIVEPSLGIDSSLWEDLPNVVVIDGLDECVDHRSQGRLLHVIQKVTTFPHTSIPWTFLICSRPEPQIHDAFAGFGTVLECLDINSSDKANQDIEMFFVDRFTDIRKRHPALRHESELWPSKAVVDQLVSRAQGQFIFAVTVINYVDTRDERPQDQLKAILRVYVDAGCRSPYSDLDLLYRYIVSQCLKWDKVVPILRLVVNRHSFLALHTHSGPHDDWRSPNMIEALLGLQKGDVTVLLSRLHAVLSITDETTNIYIPHVSFAEFLHDPCRSARYCLPSMAASEYQERVATLLVNTLVRFTAHYPPLHPQTAFTAALPRWVDALRSECNWLVYDSCRHWYDYCVRVQDPSPALLAALNKLDPYSLLAVSLSCNLLPLTPGQWEFVIAWAEGFRGRTNIDDFVEKASSCKQGYSVGFPPGMPRKKALWRTLEMQMRLSSKPDHQQASTSALEHSYMNWTPEAIQELDCDTLRITMDTDAAGFYQDLYTIDESVRWEIVELDLPHIAEEKVLIVFPYDKDGCFQFPDGWVTLNFTKDDGSILRLGSGNLRRVILLDDLREDTWRVVSQHLVKKDDLIHLKSYTKKLWQIFLLEDKLYCNSFLNSTYGIWPSALNESSALPQMGDEDTLSRRFTRFIATVCRRKHARLEYTASEGSN